MPFKRYLILAEVGPAVCNKSPYAIMSGRDPRSRWTHLSGPLSLSGSRARCTRAARRPPSESVASVALWVSSTLERVVMLTPPVPVAAVRGAPAARPAGHGGESRLRFPGRGRLNRLAATSPAVRELYKLILCYAYSGRRGSWARQPAA